MKRKQQTTYTPRKDIMPEDFCNWWNPSGRDELSGADIGGHPDAERVWARKDAGRFTRRTYGINAPTAWLSARYRAEYTAWVNAGRPKRDEPFVSLASPITEQVEFWQGVKSKLKDIGKKVPKPKPQDYDKGKAPFVEPLDEKKQLEEGYVDAEFTKIEGDTDDESPIPF
jgi:hypothetical protein